MSDRAMLRIVYLVQIVFACALMLHWFVWAPGGRAGKNTEDPWPIFKKGGWADNIGEIATQLGLLFACLWTEWLKNQISRRIDAARHLEVRDCVDR